MTDNPPEAAPVPPVIQPGQCQFCHAVIEPQLQRCWLCGASQPNAQRATNPYTQVPPQKPAHGPQPTQGESSVYDTLMTVMLGGIVFVTVLLAIGIGIEEPGMLVFYGIFALPPLFVAGVQGLMQVSKEGKARPGSLVLSWLVSVLIMIGLAALLIVAALVMLIVYCFAELSPGP